MKKADIRVGEHYTAKVSGALTTVRVDHIREMFSQVNGRDTTVYDVTNLRTGRTTTFRSAAKFLRPATLGDKPVEGTSLTHAEATKIANRMISAREAEAEGEQRLPFAAPDAENRLERTDYALTADALNGTSDSPTHSGVTTPTNPTTNGRHWTTPASLKGDQPAAFQTIVTRIDRGERVTKLCGYAGSGKTFLIAEVAKWALAQKYQTTVVAPTHKAAGVIEEKLERAGVPVGDGKDAATVDVRTIHSLLGLTLAPDMENDTGGRILKSGDGKSKLRGGLVICDEASMVGEVLKGHIDASPPSVRWLFVGDLAQLPPVGEGVSELLDEPDAVLSTVLRQGEGSEILGLATRIRNGDLDLEYAPGKDVGHVDDAEELFQAALKRFDTPEYKADPAHARVLVFRNARRTGINTRMRQLLVGAPEPYVPGEWLVMYSAFSPEKSNLNVLCEAAKRTTKGTRESGRSWGRFFDAKRSMEGRTVNQLHVSQEVRVVAVEDGQLSIGSWTFNVHRLTVEDRDGKTHVLPVLTADEVQRHQTILAEQAAKARELGQKRNQHPQGSWEWQELDRERKAAWGVFFSLEETFAQVDYAYAMTVHKSQGSTFDHAFVDVPDLMSSGGMQQRILYTAVTRPSKSLTFYA